MTKEQESDLESPKLEKLAEWINQLSTTQYYSIIIIFLLTTTTLFPIITYYRGYRDGKRVMAHKICENQGLKPYKNRQNEVICAKNKHTPMRKNPIIVNTSIKQ